MEDIVDLIFSDSSASQVSDTIKDVLYSKSADKIDELRPLAANSLFGNNDSYENN
jgi:hypothetical protein